MDQPVSKLRTKKAKSRLKKADKGVQGKTQVPIGRKVSVGALLAACAWLIALALMDLNQPLSELSIGARLSGNVPEAVMLLIGLAVTALFLHITQPKTLRNNSHLLLLVTLSLFTLLPARGILHLMQDTMFNMGPEALVDPTVLFFLIPFSLGPLLATILINPRVGVTLGIWTTYVCAILAAHSDTPLFAPHDANPVYQVVILLICGLLSTMVTVLIGRKVRTRSRLFRIGMYIGLCKIAGVLALSVLLAATTSPTLITQQTMACLMSGVFTAVVAMLVVPLFEALFKITTDITLLELSDLGHPILQRMAIEAPGTYHHSLVIANLAAAAADEIGANSLEARVCSYFHDIGKLTKPEFFAENIQHGQNPHDDLTPSMSTLIIMAHVKEGISMGRSHKLPKPLLDVIQEHHGTSVVQFFLYKAVQAEKKAAEDDSSSKRLATTIQEKDFRYPGPRPQSRVSAIISLADSIEAASRSMERPSPGHIENLINDIIYAKLEDNQLDLCDLTFSDLTKVKRSFIFTLTNMLHGRIAYPKANDNDQQSASDSNQRTENRDTDDVPADTNEAAGSANPVV